MFTSKTRQKLIVPACVVGLAMGLALPAQAQIVGTVVGAYNSSTPVGSANADGSVNFYALLNGSGTYGVGGAGLSADNCTISNSTDNCGGGVLDMWFRFTGVTTGANVLTLQYNDLDLSGVNDPGYFLESVRIYSNNSTSSTAFIDQETDPGVNQPLSNLNNQLIQLNLTVTSSPTFYVRTRYVTTFSNSAPNGQYTNTVETVRATLVPEPGMLSLLGAGLVAAGWFGRRRRKALNA